MIIGRSALPVSVVAAIADFDGLTLVKENVMKLATLRSVLLYGTLLSSTAVCNSMIPSCSL